MNLKRVTVFCASSTKCDEVYFNAARRLGKELAKNGITILYGGGSLGLMGAVADSAMENGGTVIGYIPGFMDELEWGHENITELHLVKDMHERKKMMLENSDAVITLPGGCGTFEELLEVISLKRLGQYFNPIIILNTNNYYQPLIQMLENSIKENFMNPEHGNIWKVVNEPEEVLPAILNSPRWNKSAIHFAQV